MNQTIAAEAAAAAAAIARDWNQKNRPQGPILILHSHSYLVQWAVDLPFKRLYVDKTAHWPWTIAFQWHVLYLVKEDAKKAEKENTCVPLLKKNNNNKNWEVIPLAYRFYSAVGLFLMKVHTCIFEIVVSAVSGYLSQQSVRILISHRHWEVPGTINSRV